MGSSPYYLGVVGRVLAVFAVDLERKATLGLLEKCWGLVMAARESGHEVVAAFPCGTECRITASKHYEKSGEPGGHGNSKRAQAYRYWGFWKSVEAHLRTDDYDVLWLRAHPISIAQKRLIRYARRRGTRVLYDIPTYPFDRERQSMLQRLLSRSTPALRDIAPYIDRFVTLSDHKRIQGVRTIKVRNGVMVPAEGRILTSRSGPYRLIGLGQWSMFHGLDRLLPAIADGPGHYVLRIAGDGPGMVTYQRLAATLGINVQWLPPAFGEVRDDLLVWADAGVGSLAIHRKGVYPDQALKHRVYAAAGLPFVCTTDDPHWNDVNGVWQIPADETPVHEPFLRRRLNTFRQDANGLRQPLREAAAQTCWSVAYAPLFDYISRIK